MNQQERQAVIDEYISETGENFVVPAAFIEWLRPKNNHPAHGWFFSKPDADAALEYRMLRFRQFANGLRITVQVSYSDPVSTLVKLIPREFPAMVSPVSGRQNGGGYQAFDPNDSALMEELRRQGVTAMRSWLARYRGAFEAIGVDLSPLEKIGSPVGDAVARTA
jgi:hypothetical protein